VIASVQHAPLVLGGKFVDGCQQFQVLRCITGREQMYEYIPPRRNLSAWQRDLMVAAAQGQQFVFFVENHVGSFTWRRIVGANTFMMSPASGQFNRVRDTRVEIPATRSEPTDRITLGFICLICVHPRSSAARYAFLGPNGNLRTRYCPQINADARR
jgi:hypothetical protein